VVGMGIAVVASVLLVKNRQYAANTAKTIVVKDQAGTDVESDMIKLKAYATNHMKVNVMFTLKGSYGRAVTAAQAQAKASSSSAVYTAAQASCDKRGVDSIRQSQCVAAYIAAHGGTTAPVSLPDVTKYTYHFSGPAWTFDAPGLLFVAAALLGIFSIASIVHRAVAK